MAKYIKKEIVDLNNTGSTMAYYRMKRSDALEFGEFLQRCHHTHQLYGPSVLHGVLIAVFEQLANELANGNSVKLDGLGTFNAKLGLGQGKEMDSFEEGTTRRNAMSIEVKGVSYRVDKELVRRLNSKCHLERGGEDRIRKSKYTIDERIERARRYLRKAGVMHVRDYAALTGLSHTTAYRELRKICGTESGITSRGYKSGMVYFLMPEGSSQ